MFDLSDPAVLVATCLLAGLSIAVGVYAVGVDLLARGRSAQVQAAGPGDIRRGLGRKRVPQGVLALVLPILPVFVAVVRVLGLASLRQSLAERYARAGFPGGLSDEEVVACGLLLGLLLAVPVGLVLLVVQPLAVPLALLMIVAGPGVLSAILNDQGEKRELAITRTMPFVLDLLVLTMRAGASMHQAIERVSLDYAGHPIGVEFSSIQGELDTGVTTREAFESLGQRVPIDAVKAFVDDLVQGEELGRPLADVFERLANQARVRRVQDALDTAGRAKVLVLIPGMLVFMATLLLLFSPFIVRWYYGGYTLE